MRRLVSTLGLILCLGGSAWAQEDAPTVPTAEQVEDGVPAQADLPPLPEGLAEDFARDASGDAVEGRSQTNSAMASASAAYLVGDFQGALIHAQRAAAGGEAAIRSCCGIRGHAVVRAARASARDVGARARRRRLLHGRRGRGLASSSGAWDAELRVSRPHPVAAVQALQHASVVLSAQPFNARAYMQRAAALGAFGFTGLALLDSTRAVALAPHDGDGLVLHAQMLLAAGHCEEAKRVSAQACDALPQSPRAHYLRAVVLRRCAHNVLVPKAADPVFSRQQSRVWASTAEQGKVGGEDSGAQLEQDLKAWLGTEGSERRRHEDLALWSQRAVDEQRQLLAAADVALGTCLGLQPQSVAALRERSLVRAACGRAGEAVADLRAAEAIARRMHAAARRRLLVTAAAAAASVREGAEGTTLSSAVAQLRPVVGTRSGSLGKGEWRMPGVEVQGDAVLQKLDAIWREHAGAHSTRAGGDRRASGAEVVRLKRCPCFRICAPLTL